MLDAKLRPLIDPPLNALGKMLAGLGVTANMVTIVGLVAGIAAAVAIGSGEFGWALTLIMISRVLDGLDGAVARATKLTNFGGYLDIVADFVFYVAVPLGFGFASPANLPFALILVASFTLTGISFLAYAVMAAKNNIQTSAHGQKSFFYSTGLAEGTETIIVFSLMCLMPQYFPTIAIIYAAMALITVLQRTIIAWIEFKHKET